jgi:hypothetical protein
MQHAWPCRNPPRTKAVSPPGRSALQRSDLRSRRSTWILGLAVVMGVSPPPGWPRMSRADVHAFRGPSIRGDIPASADLPGLRSLRAPAGTWSERSYGVFLAIQSVSSVAEPRPKLTDADLADLELLRRDARCFSTSQCTGNRPLAPRQGSRAIRPVDWSGGRLCGTFPCDPRPKFHSLINGPRLN